jgi:hypothetical protein
VFQIKERAPTPLFFCCFTLGPTFGFFKDFGGMSELIWALQYGEKKMENATTIANKTCDETILAFS